MNEQDDDPNADVGDVHAVMLFMVVLLAAIVGAVALYFAFFWVMWHGN